MLAQKTRIFYYVHKPKQPTALIYFKRLASRVRCSFCKGVFNVCYTTLLGLKGNMCLRRMSVSRSKRLNKEIPDRCWRKDRKPHCELFSVFIIHSLTCFMQANLVPFWFWLVPVRSEHPEIPWRGGASLRNVIAHEYFGLDNEIIWDVIQTQIPDLIEKFRGLKTE